MKFNNLFRDMTNDIINKISNNDTISFAKEEVSKIISSCLQKTFNKLDLVTSEEFNIQAELLKQLENKIFNLEADLMKIKFPNDYL